MCTKTLLCTHEKLCEVEAQCTQHCVRIDLDVLPWISLFVREQTLHGLLDRSPVVAPVPSVRFSTCTDSACTHQCGTFSPITVSHTKVTALRQAFQVTLLVRARVF